MIRRSGEEKWRAPKVTSYTDEAALQALVAESPDLLGSSESLAVITEMTVPGVGSVDLVAVGGSGRVTLVECKLRANPEMRRHVIGQVFAYAAGIWSVSYEEFDRLFTARAGRSLTAAVANASGMDVDWDQDIFGRNVAANLGAGRFDLVIAVDSVTDELKQVVRYLNEHTVLEIRVLALELGFVADGDVQVLVPAVYGEESASRKTQGGRKWDEASLFEALERVCPEGTGLIRLLYAKAQAGGLDLYWGDGSAPSVTAYLDVGGIHAPVWSCYTHTDSATWDVNFDWMRIRGVSVEVMDRLAFALSAIEGVASGCRRPVQPAGTNGRRSRSGWFPALRRRDGWWLPSTRSPRHPTPASTADAGRATKGLTTIRSRRHLADFSAGAYTSKHALVDRIGPRTEQPGASTGLTGAQHLRCVPPDHTTNGFGRVGRICCRPPDEVTTAISARRVGLQGESV